jgi:hypothetical protein
MQDRNWMLNRSAIGAAKLCVQVIQDELGVKLKLSHPDFMELIAEYCEMTESESLVAAYQELSQYAGVSTSDNVVPIVKDMVEINAPATKEDERETVEFKGKEYLRFDQSGREFQGLYRGAARYI